MFFTRPIDVFDVSEFFSPIRIPSVRREYIFRGSDFQHKNCSNFLPLPFFPSFVSSSLLSFTGTKIRYLTLFPLRIDNYREKRSKEKSLDAIPRRDREKKEEKGEGRKRGEPRSIIN